MLEELFCDDRHVRYVKLAGIDKHVQLIPEPKLYTFLQTCLDMKAASRHLLLKFPVESGKLVGVWSGASKVVLKIPGRIWNNMEM